MPPIDQLALSRREREIMDIVIEKGECSAQDVLESLNNPPSYSAVRAHIARLVQRDLVSFHTEGTRHIYRPNIAEKSAQSSALKRLLKTFFRGNRVRAVTALLDLDSSSLSDNEIAELERKISRIKSAQLKGPNSQ